MRAWGVVLTAIGVVGAVIVPLIAGSIDGVLALGWLLGVAIAALLAGVTLIAVDRQERA